MEAERSPNKMKVVDVVPKTRQVTSDQDETLKKNSNTTKDQDKNLEVSGEPDTTHKATNGKDKPAEVSGAKDVASKNSNTKAKDDKDKKSTSGAAAAAAKKPEPKSTRAKAENISEPELPMHFNFGTGKLVAMPRMQTTGYSQLVSAEVNNNRITAMHKQIKFFGLPELQRLYISSIESPFKTELSRGVLRSQDCMSIFLMDENGMPLHEAQNYFWSNKLACLTDHLGRLSEAHNFAHVGRFTSASLVALQHGRKSFYDRFYPVLSDLIFGPPDDRLRKTVHQLTQYEYNLQILGSVFNPKECQCTTFALTKFLVEAPPFERKGPVHKNYDAFGLKSRKGAFEEHKYFDRVMKERLAESKIKYYPEVETDRMDKFLEQKSQPRLGGVGIFWCFTPPSIRDPEPRHNLRIYEMLTQNVEPVNEMVRDFRRMLLISGFQSAQELIIIFEEFYSKVNEFLNATRLSASLAVAETLLLSCLGNLVDLYDNAGLDSMFTKLVSTMLALSYKTSGVKVVLYARESDVVADPGKNKISRAARHLSKGKSVKSKELVELAESFNNKQRINSQPLGEVAVFLAQFMNRVPYKSSIKMVNDPSEAFLQMPLLLNDVDENNERAFKWLASGYKLAKKMDNAERAKRLASTYGGDRVARYDRTLVIVPRKKDLLREPDSLDVPKVSKPPTYWEKIGMDKPEGPRGKPFIPGIEMSNEPYVPHGDRHAFAGVDDDDDPANPPKAKQKLTDALIFVKTGQPVDPRTEVLVTDDKDVLQVRAEKKTRYGNLVLALDDDYYEDEISKEAKCRYAYLNKQVLEYRFDGNPTSQLPANPKVPRDYLPPEEFIERPRNALSVSRLKKIFDVQHGKFEPVPVEIKPRWMEAIHFTRSFLRGTTYQVILGQKGDLVDFDKLVEHMQGRLDHQARRRMVYVVGNITTGQVMTLEANKQPVHALASPIVKRELAKVGAFPINGPKLSPELAAERWDSFFEAITQMAAKVRKLVNLEEVLSTGPFVDPSTNEPVMVRPYDAWCYENRFLAEMSQIEPRLLPQSACNKSRTVRNTHLQLFSPWAMANILLPGADKEAMKKTKDCVIAHATGGLVFDDLPVAMGVNKLRMVLDEEKCLHRPYRDVDDWFDNLPVRRLNTWSAFMAKAVEVSRAMPYPSDEPKEKQEREPMSERELIAKLDNVVRRRQLRRIHSWSEGLFQVLPGGSDGHDHSALKRSASVATVEGINNYEPVDEVIERTFA